MSNPRPFLNDDEFASGCFFGSLVGSSSSSVVVEEEERQRVDDAWRPAAAATHSLSRLRRR